MKVDDNSVEIKLAFDGLDSFWYEMGKKSYLNHHASTDLPKNATKVQMESFRKGVLDAARDLGDLEREDFYSESEYKNSQKNM